MDTIINAAGEFLDVPSIMPPDLDFDDVTSFIDEGPIDEVFGIFQSRFLVSVPISQKRLLYSHCESNLKQLLLESRKAIASDESNLQKMTCEQQGGTSTLSQSDLERREGELKTAKDLLQSLFVLTNICEDTSAASASTGSSSASSEEEEVESGGYMMLHDRKLKLLVKSIRQVLNLRSRTNIAFFRSEFVRTTLLLLNDLVESQKFPVLGIPDDSDFVSKGITMANWTSQDLADDEDVSYGQILAERVLFVERSGGRVTFVARDTSVFNAKNLLNAYVYFQGAFIATCLIQNFDIETSRHLFEILFGSSSVSSYLRHSSMGEIITAFSSKTSEERENIFTRGAVQFLGMKDKELARLTIRHQEIDQKIEELDELAIILKRDLNYAIASGQGENMIKSISKEREQTLQKMEKQKKKMTNLEKMEDGVYLAKEHEESRWVTSIYSWWLSKADQPFSMAIHEHQEQNPAFNIHLFELMYLLVRSVAASVPKRAFTLIVSPAVCSSFQELKRISDRDASIKGLLNLIDKQVLLVQ